MSKRTPTYESGGEVRPKCADCGFRTSWGFIRECNNCMSYMFTNLPKLSKEKMILFFAFKDGGL